MKTILLLLLTTTCYASEWTEALADSIYRAEGGAKTSHPYGIMVRYKSTTPRQACLNTIRTNVRRWKQAGCPDTFVEFMADRYCPRSADPVGNINWKANVSKFMLEKNQSLNPKE